MLSHFFCCRLIFRGSIGFDNAFFALRVAGETESKCIYVGIENISTVEEIEKSRSRHSLTQGKF
jgi:hypothetical protein